MPPEFLLSTNFIYFYFGTFLIDFFISSFSPLVAECVPTVLLPAYPPRAPSASTSRTASCWLKVSPRSQRSSASEWHVAPSAQPAWSQLPALPTIDVPTRSPAGGPCRAPVLFAQCVPVQNSNRPREYVSRHPESPFGA